LLLGGFLLSGCIILMYLTIKSMKAPSLVVLNKFRMDGLNLANRLAEILAAAGYNAPAVPIRAAIPALPAKPTNPAVAANALFPGSPAFAAGAARPAFPAVTAPAVVALPTWSGACSYNSGTELWEVFLPVASNLIIVGAGNSDVPTLKLIGEITPTALTVPDYIGVAGNAPLLTVADADTSTIEKLLYKTVNALVLSNTVNVTIADGTWNNIYSCKVLRFPKPSAGGGGIVIL
jgi:hypothetical protein